MEPESIEEKRDNGDAATPAIPDALMKRLEVAFELHEQRLEAIVAKQEEWHGRRTLSPVLTVRETAKRMKVSVRTVQEWLATRSLAHFKMGRVVRIQLSDLHEFWGEHYCLGRKNRRRGLW